MLFILIILESVPSQSSLPFSEFVPIKHIISFMAFTDAIRGGVKDGTHIYLKDKQKIKGKRLVPCDVLVHVSGSKVMRSKCTDQRVRITFVQKVAGHEGNI